jgi:Zn-dependent alcohol dehydrogenase
MKTRAAVALEKGKPLTVTEVELDGPKASEVLVEVKATGICHTDEFTLSGADPEGLFPAILGHEGAGIVVDVGPGVTSVKKGDRDWCQSVIIGVAPAGAEIATRPFQLVTGRVWKGTAFGGARGRTDVPKIVDWYMEGKIEIDPMITHTMPLPDINKGFELMHEGKSIRSVVVY